MLRWAYQNWQVIVSVFVGTVSIAITVYFARLQYRQARAKQGEDFRRALREGREWQERGEKPWHTYEEKEDCEKALQEADNAYKTAYEYARTKEEKALVCLYCFICAELRAGLTEYAEVREELLRASEQFVKKGLRYNRKTMVKEALLEARKYKKYFENSGCQRGLYQNMASILYGKAREWERDKRRAAEIAFESGKWLSEIGDPHAAKEALQWCQRLNPNHKEAFFEMAMVDISLGPDYHCSAIQNLRRHLEINSDDAEAREWIELLLKET